jgi:hypothetical protein
VNQETVNAAVSVFKGMNEDKPESGGGGGANRVNF